MNPAPWKQTLALCAALIPSLLSAGPLQRQPNTTLQMPETPPPLSYKWTNAFNGMVFTNPVCIVSAPGETNRIFIVEKHGRILVITNLANPNRTLFMDIRSRVNSGSETSVGDERGLLSMAFHPGYATNRYFFVWYTGTNTTADGTGLHDILSRFEISPVNQNTGLVNSEFRLFTQRDHANNHNGGTVAFGPSDGYLYLSLGDEGDHFGDHGNAQRIDKDFFAGMLRIDVDKRPENLEPNPHPAIVTNVDGTARYSVPIDNPFVHTGLGGDWDGTFNGAPIPDLSKVRTEFWAVGLRHAFRFSFSPIDGTLYLGDVGEQVREEINIIERGKNYGWNWYEGELITTNLGWPSGSGATGAFPAALENTLPLHSYTQGAASETWAVIGGFVYTGQRLTDLYGAYIFGDYGQGYVWALRHSGTNVTELSVLLQDNRITTFGIDPSNGDILCVSPGTGRNAVIRRLISSTNANPNAPVIPPTLAQTGAFSDLATLTPNAGIVPYSLNVPFWSDNDIKSRWFSIPNIAHVIGFDRNVNWSFPTGAVWIKHFELELTNGISASRRRLETRFLVKNTDGVYGVTYRWGNSLTNATLVADEGMNEAFVINDGGNIRTQVWRYPSRIECVQCHTEQGGFGLGFNTAQLNCDFSYNGTNANQIQALSDAGYFNTNVTAIHLLPALAHATNTAVSLEYRVRSYLAANCSQCHQGDNGMAFWDARITTPTAVSGIINGALVNSLGNPANRVVVPGSIDNSVLHTRIATLGGNRMPPIGSTVLDDQNIALVSAWITNSLPNYQSFAAWQAGVSWNEPGDADALADPDDDGASNYLEFLAGTDPLSALSVWKIHIARADTNVNVSFEHVAHRGFELQFAEDVAGPAWAALDVPENKPFFSDVTFTNVITDTVTNSRVYRVRVFEP